MADPLLVTAVGLALALAAMIGFHDASNSVSTSIVTRTLRERTALRYAATLNLLGGLLGVGLMTLTVPVAFAVLGLGEVVALTGHDLAPLHAVLFGAVIGTLVWDAVTWWLGIPSSTWHAMTGAVGGAALAIGHAGPWLHGVASVVVPSVLSPVAGSVLAFLLLHGIARLTATEIVTTRHLRFAQTVTAGAVAVGHGARDVAIPAALVILAVGPGTSEGRGAPGSTGMPAMEDGAWLAVLACVVAMALGTLAGGHRLIRTVGTRLTELSTPQGLAAEASTALTVGLLSVAPGTPISTSLTLTSAVVGAGTATGVRSVRWRMVLRIVLTWLATPLAAGVLGLLVTAVIRQN